ncbi:MAG TPA: phosphatase PAP2 family protein [Longimicrobiaceae bacterium]|nr:phosphatase PAP2 family protein [Longimicrobiaceae bacterium]
MTPAPPAARPAVTLRGLGLAAVNLGKGLLLVLALAGLLVVRFPVPPVVHAAAVAALLAAVGILARRGSDFRTWAAYVLGFVLFAQLRTLADEAGFPVRWEYVVSLERALFGGALPTVWLQERFFTPGTVRPWDAAGAAVYVSYFFLPHVFALALWRFRPALFRGYVAAALTAFYAGLLACVLVPTVPPWMASQAGDIPRVFTVVSGVLRGWDADAFAYGHRVAGTNPVAAMPSLHTAITCVLAIGMWRLRRWAGVLGWAYAAAMGATLVYAGEHYVADVIAGVALAALAWRVADRVAPAYPRRVPDAAGAEPALTIPARQARAVA